jgi:hypothetical protein
MMLLSPWGRYIEREEEKGEREKKKQKMQSIRTEKTENRYKRTRKKAIDLKQYHWLWYRFKSN